MHDALVCCNDRDRYPARIDPDEVSEGFVKPYFTLETVCRIAADTQEAAARHGHGSVDTVHVIDGGEDRGRPRAVVIVVCWMYLDSEDKRTEAVQIVEPNDEGLYPVGADWCWYALTEDLDPIHPYDPARARLGAYRSSVRETGAVLRRLLPGATSATVAVDDGMARITAVQTAGITAWPTGTDADGEDGYGPFDTETLGEADEVLRKALDHGRDEDGLRDAEWQPTGDPGEYRITFPPAGK